MDDVALKDKYPILYQVSIQISHTISDVGIWDGEEWYWDLQWRRTLFAWEETLVVDLLLLINLHKPSRVRQDSLVWSPDVSKGYSVQSFMALVVSKVYQRTITQEIVDFVCKRNLPLEHNFKCGS